MSDIILEGEENSINVALNGSAVVGSINVNGTRLEQILVVETLTDDSSVITTEEIEIGIPIEFDKYVSVDANQISKVCRTCLCEKSDMHSLFETWEVETVAEMLTSFAAVQLSFGDGLPESVCAECSELVGKCFAFKQLCERSESVLRCLVTQGHLQGMKQEVNNQGNTAKTQVVSRESLDEKPGSYDNKLEPPDYEEFLDEEFQDSTPSVNILTPDTCSEDKSTMAVNKKYRNTLSIYNNPIIVINPSTRYKRDTKRRVESSRKYVNKTIIKGTANGRTRSGRNLASLSNKSRKIKNLFKTDAAIDPELVVKHEYIEKKPQIEDYSFTCMSCGKRFMDQRKLKRHERTHLEVKPFQCSICKKGFIESSDLTRHARKHAAESTGTGPEESRRVACSQCHLGFSCEGDLLIHSSVHLAAGERRVCRHCGKEFPTTLQLKRHVRTHLADKPHKCRVCHKGFPERGSLTRHFRSHTGETREKKHICATCGKAYYDRHALSIHERTHTGEKPWICCDCGRGFIDSRLLNSHMKTHSDLKPYTCNICNVSFKHESTLTTHVRTHTGEKPYVCSVCGNAFVQSSNLSLHMRTHTREKPYSCEYCMKKFSSSSALTTHTRIHTGEKPYICKICDKRFARHDMTAHMRTHTGEKPFVCSVCSKRFTTPGQLQQHTRIHTGERPFICTICSKGCTTSSYLKKHMKKSHTLVTLPSADLPLILATSPKQEQLEATENCEFLTPDGQTAEFISAGQVINMANTLTLTSNTLNVVAVANANGELSITTANALNVATLTASGESVETIVTNTLVSEEKLYQFDPSLLRIHHVSGGNLVHSGQLTISELTDASP